VQASGGHPAQRGHLTDNVRLAFADKLERKAEKSEVESKTPLALDTSAADGRIPPDLAALQLEPHSPTDIDHVAIARAALEALPPERRRKVLARVPLAPPIGCIAPETLANEVRRVLSMTVRTVVDRCANLSAISCSPATPRPGRRSSARDFSAAAPQHMRPASIPARSGAEPRRSHKCDGAGAFHPKKVFVTERHGTGRLLAEQFAQWLAAQGEREQRSDTGGRSHDETLGLQSALLHNPVRRF